jgi:uncharacterized HAD superfamily protein
MKLLNIAFDLDGTLIELMPTFERILFEKHNASIVQHDSFKILTEPELPWSVLEQVFFDAFECIDEIQVYPGVYEVLNKLYTESDNDPIRIITARPAWKAANATYKLVNKVCQDVPFEIVIVGTPDNTHMIGPMAEKHTYLNRYDYYVDDRRKAAIELSEKYNKRIFMPNKRYNKLPLGQRFDGIIPIADISELIYHIDDTFYTEV